jgi:drug/metabolite transporter (DMT)-like permease
VLVVDFEWSDSSSEQNYYYAILVLIASICYAVNVNLIKKHLHDLSPLTTIGNMVLFVPAFIVLFSLVFFEVVQDVKVQESVLFNGSWWKGIANILFFRFKFLHLCLLRR